MTKTVAVFLIFHLRGRIFKNFPSVDSASLKNKNLSILTSRARSSAFILCCFVTTAFWIQLLTVRRSWLLCRRVQCRPHQSVDHVRVRGVKGQTIHLHGQVPSFPTSYSETHQCGQEGLLLVHTNTKRAEWNDFQQTIFSYTLRCSPAFLPWQVSSLIYCEQTTWSCDVPPWKERNICSFLKLCRWRRQMFKAEACAFLLLRAVCSLQQNWM